MKGRWEQRAGPRSRGGIAAVELALCLPFLLTLALGAIEVCNVMYVRAEMFSAAYEAARYATRPTTAATLGATNPDAASNAVTSYCSTLLGQLGVNGATPTLTVISNSTSQAENLTSASPLDLVTVSVSAPLSQNFITRYVIPTSITMNASATLIVE